MGIVNASKLCTILEQRSFVPHTQIINDPTILYIDGPILLFCANMPNKEHFQHLAIIKKKLQKIVKHTTIQFPALKYVYIYFDGESPTEKRETQNKRSKKQLFIQYKQLRDDLMSIKQINNITCETKILEKGEAELEIYLQRDQQYTSVIYTKDSDIYSIAYHHMPKTSVDNVYIIMDQLSHGARMLNFFDMSKFHYKHLTKNVFHYIVAMCGTDYTQTFYSPTMLLVIIKLEDIINDEDIILLDKAIESGDITFVYNYFHLIFLKSKCTYTKLYNKVAIDQNQILWYLKYIQHGKDLY